MKTHRWIELLVMAALASARLAGEDCNHNGVEDLLDLTLPGSLEPTFSLHPYSSPIPIAGGARAVLTADLDGDSDVDVATASFEGAVSLFLQRGAGVLDAPVEYAAVGLSATSLLAADLDADGDLDLAVGHGDGDRNGAVAVLLNLGGGLFQREATVESRGAIRDLAAADLDGDGSVDVAAAAPFQALVFANVAARLAPPVALVVGSNPFAIEAGDWNRDGLADLATANFLGQGIAENVSVLLHQEGGGFEPPRSFAVREGLPDMVQRDFNQDGNVDLVVSNAALGAVSGLFGDGAGRFEHRDLVLLNSQPQGERLALALEDFDGDGDIDVSATDPSREEIVMAFQEANGAFRVVAAFHYGSGDAGPRALGAADMEGDGDPDLVVAQFVMVCAGGPCRGNGGIQLLANLGVRDFRGNWGEVTEHLMGGQFASSVTAADLDLDGRLDLVANLNEQVGVLLQGGREGFLPAASYPVGGGGAGAPVTVADLSGDGHPDLAVPDAAAVGSVSVLLNRRDGTFPAAKHYLTRSASPVKLIAVDFDGDGAPDLATANTGWNGSEYLGPDVSVLRNLGDGSFAEGMNLDSGVVPDQYANCVIASDLNADGTVDLAVSLAGAHDPACGCVTGDGAVIEFLNDGRGTFHAAGSHPVGKDPIHIVPVDLNGDGRVDLATPDHISNTASVLLGLETGSFQEASRHAVGVGPISLVAVDLDGDGAPDLVTGNYDSGDVSVLFGLGDGHHAPEARITLLGRHPSSLIAADFTGDGAAELIASVDGGVDERGVSVLVNAGQRAFFQAFYPTSVLPIPTWVHAADLNGDGRLDLATANNRLFGGSVTVFLNLPEGATSRDSNRNGVPDECERAPFHRGDPNSSGTTDISDAFTILAFLFLGDAAPRCLESADANNDGRVDIADAIFLLGFLFLGGEPPPLPGPPPSPCGMDPDLPGSPGDLGCTEYSDC